MIAPPRPPVAFDGRASCCNEDRGDRAVMSKPLTAVALAALLALAAPFAVAQKAPGDSDGVVAADRIELQFRDSLLILPRSVIPDLPSNTGDQPTGGGDKPRSKRFVIQKSVIIYPPRASVPVFSRYSYSPIVLSPTPVGGRMSQWPDAKRHPLTHSVAAIDASSALNLCEITDPEIKNHNGSKIEFLRSRANRINASNSYSGVVQASNDIEAAFRISIPALSKLSDADELEFTVSAIKDIAGYVNSQLGKKVPQRVE